MVVHDSEFMRDGPALENHDTIYDPMGIYGLKKRMTI